MVSRLFGAACMVALCSRALGAQAVRGTVTDRATSATLPGVVVLLVDAFAGPPRSHRAALVPSKTQRFEEDSTQIACSERAPGTFAAAGVPRVP